MKRLFFKWRESISLWLFRKIYPIERLARALSFLSPREVINLSYDVMQPEIEKRNDEMLEGMIKSVKEGAPIGLAASFAEMEKAGLTRDIILRWLEGEKFLRAHRRKYHPEEGVKT